MKKPFIATISIVILAALVLPLGSSALGADSELDKYEAALMGDMECYFGNLHSHTAYSDGTGTPEQTFQWARDTAGYDFYAVTDHAEQVVPQEWHDIRGRADQFDKSGSFAALAGFEWTSGSGHVCVYNTQWYTDANNSRGLESLYGWLSSNNGYGQFNHPATSAGTFYEFAPTTNPGAKRMRLIETGNSGAGNNTGFFYDYFIKALDRGWMVAPVSNQDNHRLYTNSHRTGVVAGALTRGHILEALARRRVYSSDDANMKVAFKYGASWMGTSLSRGTGPCTFDVFVSDDEDIARLDLISNGGQVVASKSFSASEHVKKYAWRPTVQFHGPRAYYFVRVVERDTNDEDESHRGNQCTLTAPIWFSVPQHDLSIRVTSDDDIIAERPMYFSYRGSWGGGTTDSGVNVPKKTWYLAEGSTWPGSEEWICIQNPNNVSASITVNYMFQYGVRRRQAVKVPAHARCTIDVNSFVGPNKDVSARIDASKPVVVERPMYFNFRGLDGGSTASAVSAPARKWYFAEGATHPGFTQWLAIMNPSETTARVGITYMFAGGATQRQSVDVVAHSRKTILVNDVVGPNKDVSAVVDSNVAVIAERPMYFAYPGNRIGGSSQTGADAPATSWFFAEGTTLQNQAAGYFDEWLSVLNPGNSDTGITITYMFGDGSVKKVGKTVAAHSRRTVLVNQEIGNDRDVSVRVDSRAPVVVERPMYYSYHGALRGGDVEMGRTRGSRSWYFAEGTNRDGFEEWLTLQNPQPKEVTALVTLMLDDGSTRDFTYLLAPTSRTTITINGLMSL